MIDHMHGRTVPDCQRHSAGTMAQIDDESSREGTLERSMQDRQQRTAGRPIDRDARAHRASLPATGHLRCELDGLYSSVGIEGLASYPSLYAAL